MSTVELSSCDHGVVAKVKRCIMERDLYPRRWGMGPVATEKKKMKESGKLDKFGRANEQTPAKWSSEYTDYNAPLTVNGEQVTTEGAPAKEEAPAAAVDEVMAESPVAEKVDKKRKREGETAEEKAERKKKKAEKKEKKEKRKSKSKKEDSSDSE